MSGMCMRGDAECPSCGAAQGTLTEEDLSDAAVEDGPTQWETDVRGDLETTPAGDTFSIETGEVLKDAPGWDKTTQQIVNRDGLEWAGRHLREVEEALAENHRAASAELAELEAKLAKARARHDAADKPLLSSRAFFDTAIRAYAESHRAELMKGRRGKTARLPSGLVLAWRQTPAKHEVTDVDALWAWADDLGVIDEVFPEPPPKTKADLLSKRGLNAALAKFKNPLGVTTTPEHEELTVKVEGDK